MAGSPTILCNLLIAIALCQLTRPRCGDWRCWMISTTLTTSLNPRSSLTLCTARPIYRSNAPPFVATGLLEELLIFALSGTSSPGPSLFPHRVFPSPNLIGSGECVCVCVWLCVSPVFCARLLDRSVVVCLKLLNYRASFREGRMD